MSTPSPINLIIEPAGPHLVIEQAGSKIYVREDRLERFATGVSRLVADMQRGDYIGGPNWSGPQSVANTE